ncbi:hypothetical protein [Brevirhabdus sp.]|uniref:hypothetical protein n=1 Tax=Brevirhabdus sp. TaxID=2004514 RepID=UPI00405A3988
MAKEYEIAMLWVQGPLTYVEQLCAKSFLDAGQHVKLYQYGKVDNIPAGVEVRDGNEILSMDNFIQHGRTGSLALFSDVFRYHLLKQSEGVIWADTDAYCLRPFTSGTGHFYGWESDHNINGGVLGLPRDSDALGRLLEMTEDEYAIPEWFDEAETARLRGLQDAGTPVHVSEMQWGVWGPHAITHYLHKTGEAAHALPRHALYPMGFADRRKIMKPESYAAIEGMLRPDSSSIHFYGRRMKHYLASVGGFPPAGSYLDDLLKKHEIDPGLAPLPDALIEQMTPEAPAPSAAKQGKSDRKLSVPAVRPSTSKLVNLTDLADKYGSDKGSIKHRYTELYHLLFHPYRQRKIRFLEMGLLVGGPEHGHDPDRETPDLPSVRMWLEYFTKARIIGLDVSDFSWFRNDRFEFHRCDMDDAEQISRAADDIGSCDIILDDASHASHHQQNAFLAMFPRLSPGGIYIVEDLRWQPEAYEKPGVTKTAELFQSYLKHGDFRHSDPAVAADFNDLRGEFSGVFIHQVHYQKDRKDQVLVVHKR